MRHLLAGLLLVAFAAQAHAQVEGEIISIGFEGSYRPTCWTPLRIRMRAVAGAPAQNLVVQVVQNDLDRDQQVFTMPVSLAAAPANGKGPDVDRWMYFIPNPTAGSFTESLASTLHVYIADSRGNRIAAIPAVRAASAATRRPYDGSVLSRKIVLVLKGGPGTATLQTAYKDAKGLTEPIEFIRVRPEDLPDKVAGFESVDAVLWFDESPQQLSQQSFAALRGWVREGGRLVLSEDPTQWRQFSDVFGDMVPVIYPAGYAGAKSFEGDKGGLDALRAMAFAPDEFDLAPFKYNGNLEINGRSPIGDPWGPISKHKFLQARGVAPRAQANVERWVDDKRSSPFLVRQLYGTGWVAWTAQDLSAPDFAIEQSDRPREWRMDYSSYGWARVWDRVFDWRNLSISAVSLEMGLRSDEGNTMARSDRATVSGGLLKGMDLPARSLALVGVAVVFFLLYWAVAGPIAYFFLKRRELGHLNWPVFGGFALLGTLLTMPVTRLMLSGKPQVAHATFVRLAPGEDAVMTSNLGIYVPRDGARALALEKSDPARESWICSYPWSVSSESSAGFLTSQDYHVPAPASLRGQDEADPGIPDAPFRSTLKKFQAKWVGPTQMGVAGTLRVTAANPKIPVGTLVNNTGFELKDVHFIFQQIDPSDLKLDGNFDIVISAPDWKAGESLDMGQVLDRTNADAPETSKKEHGGRRWRYLGSAFHVTGAAAYGGSQTTQGPYTSLRDFGFLEKDWRTRLRTDGITSQSVEDLEDSALLCGIFDRMGPVRADGADYNTQRPLPARTFGRRLDCSASVGAGAVLILARCEGAVPFGLKVDGEVVEGTGTILFQIVVPVDRQELQKAPPATAPTTAQAPQGTR